MTNTKKDASTKVASKASAVLLSEKTNSKSNPVSASALSQSKSCQMVTSGRSGIICCKHKKSKDSMSLSESALSKSRNRINPRCVHEVTSATQKPIFNPIKPK